MPDPLIAVVILNTNRRDDTLACLGSLTANSYRNLRVIVADNASTDGSVESVRARFPATTILQIEENRGYAGNNNVGIAAALTDGADWVLVLNEDTILHSECIAELIAAGECDPRAGVVGPMVYHHDEPDVIQSAGGRLSARWEAAHVAQNELDRGQYREPRDVDWISGCAILVRRSVIEQIGMLDDRFFYYWEEVDWCLRASRAGWRIVHVPAARLWHKGVTRDYRPKPTVTYYATRNKFLLLSKHRAPTSVWIWAWAQALRTLTSWTLRPRWRDLREHRSAMWQGMLDFLNSRWGMRST